MANDWTNDWIRISFLTSNSNHFKVFRFALCRSVGRLIILGPKPFEVASERGLSAFIQRAECFLCGTKVISEMLDNFRWRKWKREGNLSRFCLYFREALVETLTHSCFNTPQDRWRHLCGRRNVGGNGFEHLSHQTGRCPIRHRDKASGPTYPLEFRGHHFGARSKHCPEHRYHCIKTRILVWQSFRVAFVELNFQALALSPVARLFDQIWRDINSRYDSSHSRGRKRKISCTAGHIEDLHSRS